MDILSTSVGVLIGLVVTSLFSLVESGVKKRVTVRSPESKAIAELVPAVNMVLSCMGAMLTAEDEEIYNEIEAEIQAKREEIRGLENGN